MVDANNELLSFLKQFNPETQVKVFQMQDDNCLFVGKIEDIPFNLLRNKALAALASLDDDGYLTLNLREIKRRK